MSVNSAGKLPEIDPDKLLEVVRTAENLPSFEIHDWSARPLGHQRIIDTTGGLFLVSGTGQDADGPREWSVVLKVLHDPKRREAIDHWSYWKRELLVYQTALLSELPDDLVAPRCFGTREENDAGLIWMEHIRESREGPWEVDDFWRAARQSGRFASAFLSGTALPDLPWLSAPFFRSIHADGDSWATFMDPSSSPNAWEDPIVKTAFSKSVRSEVLRVWAERDSLWEAIDRLPQVVCHNDFHRRNLMFRSRARGEDELVAVDWAFLGPGALGMDLGELVAASAFFHDIEPTTVEEFEDAALDGYLAGLADGGSSGVEHVVRLGYLLSASLWEGATLPGWAAVMLPEDSGFDVPAMFGRSRSDVLSGWVHLTEFLLERADEACHLMERLGLK